MTLDSNVPLPWVWDQTVGSALDRTATLFPDRDASGPCSKSVQVHHPGPGRSPSAITRLSRGKRSEAQCREVDAATSGQRDSTIDTKFDPLNGLPTTRVATSAMARASRSSWSR